MFGHDEGTNQQMSATDQTALSPASDTVGQDITADLSQLPSLSATDDASASAAVDLTPASTVPTSPVVGDDGLLEIKQQALQQLSPLVGHLDQTPEEKFRTTMMMIQAADDQSLIKIAYEAAQQIGDEKSRAQALLDVVNEINYFTQQNAS